MSCACAADSVLSDPAKRERYDVYGVDNSDDEYDEAEPEEEGEYLSPEDVFSMFLGIPPGARVQRRRRGSALGGALFGIPCHRRAQLWLFGGEELRELPFGHRLGGKTAALQHHLRLRRAIPLALDAIVCFAQARQVHDRSLIGALTFDLHAVSVNLRKRL